MPNSSTSMRSPRPTGGLPSATARSTCWTRRVRSWAAGGLRHLPPSSVHNSRLRPVIAPRQRPEGPHQGPLHRRNACAGGGWLDDMKATLMYGAGDVRIEDVPDPAIHAPTDAIVRMTRAAICGSDLHPYRSMPATDQGRPMGHEFLGIIEDTGAEVTGLKRGALVLSPFTYADTSCFWCRRGLQTSCPRGGRYGFDGVDGGQGEAVRVPQASGTLVKLPVAADPALLPSLMTLTDVFCTGHHAAVTARVGPGVSVAVVGDGAVGLCAVLAARRLSAGQLVLIGRHADRTDLGAGFGATGIVLASGEEGAEEVRKLTGGHGAGRGLGCVGGA